jgi:hypothetical protein
MRAWIYQHNSVVHAGVALIPNSAVFGRHLIIGHAARRQNAADLNFFLIGVGWHILAHDVLLKSRALLDAKKPRNAAGSTTQNASLNPADLSRSGGTLVGATLGSSNDTLRSSTNGKGKRGNTRVVIILFIVSLSEME